MTRAEIRNLILEATGRSDKTDLMNSAINIAVREISSQRLWYDLMTEEDLPILTGESSVTLPTDGKRFVEARLIVAGSTFLSRELIVRPKSWVVYRYPNSAAMSQGKPVYGYIEGRQLIVVPISDGDYTIRLTHCRLHPDLSADIDTLVISHAAQAVAAYATFWTFQSLEKSEDATRWYQVYQTLLATAIQVDKNNSIIKNIAQPRGAEPPSVPEYWLDPFTKSMP